MQQEKLITFFLPTGRPLAPVFIVLHVQVGVSDLNGLSNEIEMVYEWYATYSPISGDHLKRGVSYTVMFKVDNASYISIWIGKTFLRTF